MNSLTSNDVSHELLGLIEKVSRAEDERSAANQLLSTLLRLFDMDQAAFCEVVDGEAKPLFAVDRTKRILPSDHTIWLSQTLVGNALQTLEPAVHCEDLPMEAVPRSICEHSLKNVVCIPISRAPERLVYLASQRNPLRRYSASELSLFKTAAQAAALALGQHRSFRELKSANDNLEKKLRSKEEPCLYHSPLMERLLADIKRIAPFDISVVLLGESGSGKEVLAREIHRRSGRPGAFVAVNCANLTETLLESELFGHTRGAFTGAFANKKGLLQEAENGTFFFDEIAELPLGLQAKLLRVLQERQIRPLGTNRDVPISVRILAASHQDLKRAVEAGRFREDLYYRLNEITLAVPSLRERREDIELLARHFVDKFSGEFRFGTKTLTEEAVEKLVAYSWPGNIRELQNICRTATILSSRSEIRGEDIRLTFGSGAPSASASANPNPPVVMTDSAGSLREMSRRYEKDLVKSLLEEPGQNQATVAERLGISVRTLQRILSDNLTAN